MGDSHRQTSWQNFCILCASGLVCFFAGGLYGWSALIAPLQDTFGVTTGQTGLVFSLAITSFTIAVIAVPYCIPLTARQRSVSWFGLGGAVCLISATQVREFEYFLFWFSGGFGAASGAIYITTLNLAANTSFHKIATPAMVATFGVGGAFFGPVWRVLVAKNWGLESLSFLAFGLILSVLIGRVLLRQRTGNTVVYFERIETEPLPSGSSLALSMIWFTFAFGSFAGLMVLGLASKMMDLYGAGVKLASFGLAGIAFANTGGRLSVAWLLTQLRAEQCLYISIGLTSMGLVLAMLGGTLLGLCMGLVLIAGGYGIVASTVPVLTRVIFGPDQFQSNFALIFSAWGVAGFTAPWVGGVLFDQSGSFLIPLAFSLGVTLLGGLTSWWLGYRARS